MIIIIFLDKIFLHVLPSEMGEVDWDGSEGIAGIRKGAFAKPPLIQGSTFHASIDGISLSASISHKGNQLWNNVSWISENSARISKANVLIRLESLRLQELFESSVMHRIVAFARLVRSRISHSKLHGFRVRKAFLKVVDSVYQNILKNRVSSFVLSDFSHLRYLLIKPFNSFSNRIYFWW